MEASDLDQAAADRAHAAPAERVYGYEVSRADRARAGDTLADLVARGDAALYDAKRHLG